MSVLHIPRLENVNKLNFRFYIIKLFKAFHSVFFCTIFSCFFPLILFVSPAFFFFLRMWNLDGKPWIKKISSVFFAVVHYCVYFCLLILKMLVILLSFLLSSLALHVSLCLSGAVLWALCPCFTGNGFIYWSLLNPLLLILNLILVLEINVNTVPNLYLADSQFWVYFRRNLWIRWHFILSIWEKIYFKISSLARVRQFFEI